MTDFVEVKTSELGGAALDWAIAQIQIKAGEFTSNSEEHGTGRPYFNCKFSTPSLWGEGREQKGTMNKETGGPWVMHGPGGKYSPSTDWADGGPLIDKYQLDLTFERKGLMYAYQCQDDGLPIIVTEDSFGSFGSTHLVAVCRAIVAAELGDTVSIPAELVKP